MKIRNQPFVYNPLNFSEIKTEIDNLKPIIAGLQSNVGGHVVVLSGYRVQNNINQVKVLDPLYGESWVPYTELTNNRVNGRWTATIKITSNRSAQNSCNIRFIPTHVMRTCFDRWRRPYNCPQSINLPGIVCDQ